MKSGEILEICEKSVRNLCSLASRDPVKHRVPPIKHPYTFYVGDTFLSKTTYLGDLDYFTYKYLLILCVITATPSGKEGYFAENEMLKFPSIFEKLPFFKGSLLRGYIVW